MKTLGIGKTIFELIRNYEQKAHLENEQNEVSEDFVKGLNSEISELEEQLEAKIMDLIESNIDINITADVRI